MPEFLLFSRLGRTVSGFTNLREAGRLDIVHECVVSSLFLSHAIRKDTIFHAVLNGPPKPPIHLQINGQTLHDVRTDQETWTQILNNVLSAKAHPGIATNRASFENMIKTLAMEHKPIFVLEEHGTPASQAKMTTDSVFVLGDHVGLPKKAEDFTLRYGTKISLAKQPYLAAHCITIINYLLDQTSVSR